MDEQLQRRMIGVVVGVGVILLLLWMIPTRPPGDGSVAETATVSVADAAKAAQNQAALAPATGSAVVAGAASSAASSIAAPPNTVAMSSSPPAAAQTAPAPTPPPVGEPARTTTSTAAAFPSLQGSKEPAATAINPARPSASLAAALASSQPAKASVPEPALAPAAPVSTKPAVAAPAPAVTKPPVATKPAAPAPAAATPPVAAAPKATPAVASAPKPAATAAAAAKGWYVQIGSFSAADKAQLIVNLIANAGFSSEMAPVKTASGNTLYRVRSGPYSSSAKAEEALGRLHQQGYPDARKVSE